MILGNISQEGAHLFTDSPQFVCQWGENISIFVSFDDTFKGYSFAWLVAYDRVMMKTDYLSYDAESHILTIPAKALKKAGHIYVTLRAMKGKEIIPCTPVSFYIKPSGNPNANNSPYEPGWEEIAKALFEQIFANEYKQPLDDLFDRGNEAIDEVNATNTAVSEAEAIRVANENIRIDNEKIRKDAENARINAENARKASESVRADAEAARQTQESDRINAELERATAENNRINAETVRKETEADRISAEEARQAAERARATNESARMDAENERISREAERVSAETQRQSAESNRITAENLRVEAETTRVEAEIKRQADTATAISNAETAAERANEAAESAEQLVDKDYVDSHLLGWSAQKIQNDQEISDYNRCINIGEGLGTDDNYGLAISSNGQLYTALATNGATNRIIRKALLLDENKLLGTADLNNCVDMGIYHQSNNSDSTADRHYPINHAGILTVIGRAGSSMVFQTYQTYDNTGFYYRACHNGTWTSWVNLHTTSTTLSDYYLNRGAFWSTTESHDADDEVNNITFAYAANHNTPTTGPLVTFSDRTNQKFRLQIQASYHNPKTTYIRTLNGDSSTWNSWVGVCTSVGSSLPVQFDLNNTPHMGFTNNLPGNYIRMPQNGILPNVSGGNGSVGTDGWPFSTGFFKDAVWAAAHQLTSSWIGFYNEYKGTRKGWIGHNGSNTLHINNEAGESLHIANSGGRGGGVGLNLYSTYTSDKYFIYLLDSGFTKHWFNLTISAAAFETRSTEDIKANIVAFEDLQASPKRKSRVATLSETEEVTENEYVPTALELVQNSQIYQYDLKEEIDNGIALNKHYGFVIGRDAPKELFVYNAATKEPTGIDLYSMCAIAWQAVKELTSKVESLEAEIVELNNKLAE